MLSHSIRARIKGGNTAEGLLAQSKPSVRSATVIPVTVYYCYLRYVIYLHATQEGLLVTPIIPGEGNGNPLQCSCLGSPRDRGAWMATVHGVAKHGLIY